MRFLLVETTGIEPDGYRRLGVAASVTQDLIVSAVGESTVVDEVIAYVPLPTATQVPSPTESAPPTEALQPTLIPAGSETEGDSTVSATPMPTATPTPTPIDTSPNIMEIDFAALAETETDAAVKELHKYFSVAEGTRKNAYTGMFEAEDTLQETVSPLFPPPSER